MKFGKIIGRVVSTQKVESFAESAIGVLSVPIGIIGLPFVAIGKGIKKIDGYIEKKLEDEKIKKEEEDQLIEDHFESLGIRTNVSRGGSCLLQYDRKECLTKAKEGMDAQD